MLAFAESKCNLITTWNSTFRNKYGHLSEDFMGKIEIPAGIRKKPMF
jgi:hypothetical protein